MYKNFINSDFFLNKHLSINFLFLIITCLIFFSWIYELINFENLISPQLRDYFLETLSIALTEIKYGFNGYIGKTDILEQLSSSKIETIDLKIDEIIKKNNYSNNYHILSVSEVGYIDYFKISFYIFGIRITSLVNLYYSILFISYICFFFSYIEDKKRIFSCVSLLIIILLFNNLIKPTNNSELYFSPSNLFNFRYLSVLAIIPALHLFFLNNNIRKSVLSVISLFIQIIILLFVIRIRFLIIWVPIGLMLLTLINYIFYKNRKDKVIKLFIFLVLTLFITLISITDNKLKNQLYFEKSNFAFHSPAFSTLIGLLSNNDLRVKYTKIDRLENKSSKLQKYNPNRSFKTYDQDGYAAAFFWLEKNEITYHKLFNFKDNENVNYQNYFDYEFDNNKEISKQGRDFIINKDFNFELMEEINKKVLLEILKNDYLFVLKSYLFEKPLMIFLNSLKTYGFKVENYVKILIVFIFLFILKTLIFKYENNKKISLIHTIQIFFISIALPNLMTNVHSQVIHDISIVTVWILFLLFLNRFNFK